MKKWSICKLAATLTVLTQNIEAQKVNLIKTTVLENYPSASGIAFFKERLFVMGDDATNIMILDTVHNRIDSILLFPSISNRITWDIKHDIESLSIKKTWNENKLLAFPSFSNAARNKVVVLDLNKIGEYKIIKKATPASWLSRKGVNELNIEGSTQVRNYFLASNRANLTNKKNVLLWTKIKRVPQRLNKWKINVVDIPQSDKIIGLSGLEYWQSMDILLFTASTEATSSANADGQIGESYLGMIMNFSNRLGKQDIITDYLINLSASFGIGNQKIEGLALEREGDRSAIIHLVVDNDNGQSIIYKIGLTLPSP